MMQDCSGDAALAVLCQGEVGVEGGSLMGVLAVAQPGLLSHGPAQLWSRLTATCTTNMEVKVSVSCLQRACLVIVA